MTDIRSIDQVFTDKRNRLAAERTEMLLFIKHNLAAINNLYLIIGRSVRTVSEGRTAGTASDYIDNHVTLPSDG